jgi:methylglutaconyl-CoA hydratase
VKTLLIEDVNGVRTVTMNRPERHNALNPEMKEELITVFSGAAAAGVRVVVLAGAGESFCAGLDLSVLASMNDKSADEFRADAARTARLFASVWECEVPTIAQVHGAALAGGTGLAMLCDFTIAAQKAVFGFSEVRIGFVPALVGAYLPLLIGEKRARELLLSGRRISATEALSIDLINEVVEDRQLNVRVAELAKDLLANSPQSLAATKLLLLQQVEERLRSALELAADANAAARETADFREGVASFLEKRKPRWVSE